MGWSIGKVLVTVIPCIGWSIGNVEENVFGFDEAGKAGNGDGPRDVFDGEAKSPKSSSSRMEFGCEADWDMGAARLRPLRPELRLTEAGSWRD